jgi:hypothetical protein
VAARRREKAPKYQQSKEEKIQRNINTAQRKKHNQISTQHRGKNTTKYQHSKKGKTTELGIYFV